MVLGYPLGASLRVWNSGIHTRQLGNAGKHAGYEALVVLGLAGLVRLLLRVSRHLNVYMEQWCQRTGVSDWKTDAP